MQKPGSLLLAWQVKDKHTLVIGGGEVAYSRIVHLLRANAKVTVVAPEIHPEIEKLNDQGEIYSLLRRDYNPGDLRMYEEEFFFKDIGSHEQLQEHHFRQIEENVHNRIFAAVMCCVDDPVLSTQVYYQCKYLRLPVNIADKPPMCDFYFGSMFNQDSLQIMISTNGKLPRLLKMIKDDIAKQFADVKLNDAVDTLGAIRADLRARKLRDESVETIEKRMQWIKKLTDFFTLRQWSQLTLSEAETRRVVDSYPGFPPSDYEEFVKFAKS